MFGNLNRVIELAKTEYVVVLPDDDLLYPDYLDTVLGVHDDNRVAQRRPQLLRSDRREREDAGAGTDASTEYR